MSQLYYNDTPLSQMPASYPASRVTHESVSVTADGVKTYGQLLNGLFALIDATKVECGQTYIKLQETSGYDSFMPLCLLDHNEPSYMFIGEQYYNKSSNTIETYKWLVRASNSYIVKNATDSTSQIPTSGEKITIYYD